MKFELDLGSGHNLRIAAYAAGSVTVATVVYRHSIVLAPNRPVMPWPPAQFSDLAPGHFELLAAVEPEVVLIGTGGKLQFPAMDLLSPLVSRNIGFEIMDTGAACRSYNFLLGEGRQVAAALLMID